MTATRKLRVTLGALAIAGLLAAASCGDQAPGPGAPRGAIPDAAFDADASIDADASADGSVDAASKGPCTICIEGALASECSAIYAPCAANPPCQMLQMCAVKSGCFDALASAFGTCMSERCADLLGSRFDWFPILDCAFGACKLSCDSN